MEATTFLDGDWRDGNPPLMGAMTQSAWLASTTFDGARAFRRLAPDLDLHCERANRSAEAMGLKPIMPTGRMIELCWEGIERFPPDAVLYIRPMYWAEEGFVIPEADSTRFALCIHRSPFPETPAFSVCFSSYRRPCPDAAPTDAKASCLYPNVARALREANEKGFDNAVMMDHIGNVAEFATSNLFLVKDGVAVTPVPNGTFLNGITRQRVIKLLREAGVEVEERTVTRRDVLEADELFSTGNYAKVWPVNRIEDRDLQPGPIAQTAKERYFEYAERYGGR